MLILWKAMADDTDKGRKFGTKDVPKIELMSAEDAAKDVADREV